MKLFCTVIAGSSGFLNIVKRVHRVPVLFRVFKSISSDKSRVFFTMKIFSSFDLSTFEYFSLSFFSFSFFFFRFKFQTDSRHSKIIIRGEMSLFVQFRNKNIKGIERNFKVGLFLFLSGNTRNVGFSLNTFFFFFLKKMLLSSSCNFRTIFYWLFLDFFHLLSVNRYSRTR